MATETYTAQEALVAGSEALRRGDWHEAREHYETALTARESAEAWEGLGWAGWWLHDADLTVRAREQAYRAFRAAGDPAGAGRVAAWLASDFLEFRGDDAVARGWLERGHRLLDGLPDQEDQGWLALSEGAHVMNVRGDLDAAAALARRAASPRRGLRDRRGRGAAIADLARLGALLPHLGL
jgi:hypothetical protein